MDAHDDNVTFQVLEPAADTAAEPNEIETEPEDEIDELESDSDSPAKPPPATAPVKRPPASKAGPRQPGTTCIPFAKMEAAIKQEGVTGVLALSKEGLFVLAAATEEFLKQLVQGGLHRAQSAHRSTIAYDDMSTSVEQNRHLNWLRDVIPRSVPLSEALRRQAQKAKEDVENDPALTSVTEEDRATYATNHNASHGGRPKGTKRTVNGKEKLPGPSPMVNGTAPAAGTGANAAAGARHGVSPAYDHNVFTQSMLQSGTIMRNERTGQIDMRPWINWSDVVQLANAQREAAIKAGLIKPEDNNAAGQPEASTSASSSAPPTASTPANFTKEEEEENEGPSREALQELQERMIQHIERAAAGQLQDPSGSVRDSEEALSTKYNEWAATARKRPPASASASASTSTPAPAPEDGAESSANSTPNPFRSTPQTGRTIYSKRSPAKSQEKSSSAKAEQSPS